MTQDPQTIYLAGSLAAHPPCLAPDYPSTRSRSPAKPLALLPRMLAEITGHVDGHESVCRSDADLIRRHAGETLDERIIVTGRVDESDRPMPRALSEVWKASAAGCDIHNPDQHDAPLKANFAGAGRAVMDATSSRRSNPEFILGRSTTMPGGRGAPPVEEPYDD